MDIFFFGVNKILGLQSHAEPTLCKDSDKTSTSKRYISAALIATTHRQKKSVP